MQVKQVYDNLKLGWLITFTLISACVESINFDAPPAQLQLVIEGRITDAPGPYRVKISRGLTLDSVTNSGTPVEKAEIKLYDDRGNTEDFIETNPGTYETKGIIRGQVGRTYSIVVKTADGNIFQSDSEKLNPVGEVENIRAEFEARTVVESFGETRADVFNILVDADGGSAADNYIRWLFTGTYKVFTEPALHMIETPPYTPYKSPFACSGYILVGGPFGGTLKRMDICTCCECWVKQYETKPQLSDMQLISGSKFKNVKVGEVPINNITFYEKYMVEVEQMSLSRNAFEFFKLIRTQKEGASSLFQPPAGEIKGNIKAVNSTAPVIGLFWASSVKKKSFFIYPSDIPYLITPIDFITLPCDKFYPNSSATKPAGWE